MNALSRDQCARYIVWLSVMVIIGVGSNSILGGPNVIYTAIAAICAACMNINKVSRVKYWGGPAPRFLRLWLCASDLEYYTLPHTITFAASIS